MLLVVVVVVVVAVIFVFGLALFNTVRVIFSEEQDVFHWGPNDCKSFKFSMTLFRILSKISVALPASFLHSLGLVQCHPLRLVSVSPSYFKVLSCCFFCSRVRSRYYLLAFNFTLLICWQVISLITSLSHQQKQRLPTGVWVAANPSGLQYSFEY